MKNAAIVMAVLCLAFGAGSASAANGGNKGNGGGGGGGGGPVAPRACALSDISPTASACSGFFAGNLLNGSSISAQQAGLAAIGFTWNGNFSNVAKINSLGGATTVDFATANQNPISRLYGDTYVGLHFGNGAGLGGNATGFFKFDAGTTGLASFLLTISKGSSGAVLYSTGTEADPTGGGGTGSTVPEPASWAMMIAGFGLVGAAMRRRVAAVA